MKVGGKGYDPIKHPLFLKNKLCGFLVMIKKEGGGGNLTGAATKMLLKAIGCCILKFLIDEDKPFSKLHLIFRCIT